MKPHTLPVKRRNVHKKGIFKRLSAVTKNRKQRVAASANAGDMEMEDSGSKISRALTIIFLIHIVAIGLIFVHQTFLDGRLTNDTAVAKVTKVDVAAVSRRMDLPQMASGEKPYVVMQGDNYARIAAAADVDEADLRAINQQVEIVPGLLLKIPPKRIIAMDPPEVNEIRSQTPLDTDRGLVEALPLDVSAAPRAQLVRPNIKRNTPESAASGRSYVVKSGDSIWRIANRYQVNQDALMKINGISDARKMKVGMSLVIPN